MKTKKYHTPRREIMDYETIQEQNPRVKRFYERLHKTYRIQQGLRSERELGIGAMVEADIERLAR